MTSETTGTLESAREPSLLDAACEAYVSDLAEISPTQATELGIPGFEGELQDFSPEYWSTLAERKREMIMDVDACGAAASDSDELGDDDDFDDVDDVTAAVLRNRMGIDLNLHHHGEDLRLLNNIESPVQIIRDSFLLMDTATAEGKEQVRSRLSKIPKALQGYRESLSEASVHGHVAAQRQITVLIEQCEDLAESGSALEEIGLEPTDPEIGRAKAAFGDFAGWLGEHLGPMAPRKDAVGRERYERFSQLFLGDLVDLDEAYTWGLQRLCDIHAQQTATVKELYGEGVTLREAIHRLNRDERYMIKGVDNLRTWMQETADNAIADLDGAHFDIPAEIRSIQCCIDPAGTGGIFYTAPSDDLIRPGRMWWSVPEGQETFHTWQELTTVFHEGVPGHHLQLGTAITEGDRLNLWRRASNWISGHGEGWALYAEQLMSELGYLDDPGLRLGLLDSQRLRAARVVLDIGLHLGKKVPEGGAEWTSSYARSFLRENTAMDEANLAFEIDRYLGWPGQAPSYAIGQRLWENLRDEALNQGQTLRHFHARALKYGSIPMSILKTQVLR